MNLNAVIFSSKDNKREMKKYVCVFLLLFIVGCGANYSPYIGFSSYFKKTTGTSNLTYGYKDYPILDTNDPFAKSEFEKSAKDYLDGVVNDLQEVNDKADNTTKKIDAVVDAVNSGLEYFHVRHVGSVFTFLGVSNFEIFDYPEFPDFNYLLYSPPTKPYNPLFLDNEFIVDSYNADVWIYNRELADFSATVKAYIEDAEHYIENCNNDYEEIRQKGLGLLSYIESLGIDANGTGISLVHRFGGSSRPRDRVRPPRTSSRPRTGQSRPKVPKKPIRKDKLLTDESGKPVKDKDGNFIFVPVEEDVQEK